MKLFLEMLGITRPIEIFGVAIYRYGYEIYQHASHWRYIENHNGSVFYQPGQFIKCSVPGHHSCLDGFKADGNLQFDTDHTSP